MRGSVVGQVTQIWRESGINQIGESKHEAKETARQAGVKGWHEIGKQLGIHSYKTADLYRDVWIDMARYVRETYHIKDLEQLQGEHVAGYLQSKVDKELAHSTLLSYSAAIEKLETALNLYAEKTHSGRSYDWQVELKKVRPEYQTLDRFEGSRAHHNPQAIIASIRDERYHLIARVQYEGGARLDEVRITCDDLRGIRPDSVTGEIKGWIKVKGKGGKVREIGVSQDTYRQVEQQVKSNGGTWGIGDDKDRQDYREVLEEASEASGEDYTGSHGMRWDYAQRRFKELQDHGMTYNEALAQVSKEMGHERADITEHYLR